MLHQDSVCGWKQKVANLSVISCESLSFTAATSVWYISHDPCTDATHLISAPLLCMEASLSKEFCQIFTNGSGIS